MEKIYHAIVCGELARDAGEIHAAIARHPTHRKRMTVRDDDITGRSAHTSWRVAGKAECRHLVEARIHTGRTHQIRVHFQFLGHPVVGDDTYGAKQNKKLDGTDRLRRAARVAPCPRAVIHPSAHGKADEF